MKTTMILPLTVGAVLAALPLTPQASMAATGFKANVQYYHHHSHRHYSRSHHRYYHMANRPMATSAYGKYPNIQFFKENGHVYTRNLDTGDVYLSRW